MLQPQRVFHAQMTGTPLHSLTCPPPRTRHPLDVSSWTAEHHRMDTMHSPLTWATGIHRMSHFPRACWKTSPVPLSAPSLAQPPTACGPTQPPSVSPTPRQACSGDFGEAAPLLPPAPPASPPGSSGTMPNPAPPRLSCGGPSDDAVDPTAGGGVEASDRGIIRDTPKSDSFAVPLLANGLPCSRNTPHAAHASLGHARQEPLQARQATLVPTTHQRTA